MSPTQTGSARSKEAAVPAQPAAVKKGTSARANATAAPTKKAVKTTTAKAAATKAGSKTAAAVKSTSKNVPAKPVPTKATVSKITAGKATTSRSTAGKTAATKAAKSAVKTAAAKSTAAKTTTAAKNTTTKTATAAKTSAAAKTATAKTGAGRAAPATTASTATAPTARATARKTATKKSATGPAKPAALVVKPGEDPWTAAELAAIRVALEEDIVALRKEIAIAEHEIVDLMRHSGDGAGDDQADAGSKTFEREQEMSLANNAREMLIQNIHAIERLADGTYGICESCGEPIGKLRLEAAPRATLCLRCKSKQERR